jgi:hypothetical protein
VQHLYYDYDGNPIDVLEWAALFEAREFSDVKVGPRWRVATDKIGDYDISTVWMGIRSLDSFLEEGPPLIFETMVFRGGSALCDRAERYPSAQEAAEGHVRICETLRAEIELFASLELP